MPTCIVTGCSELGRFLARVSCVNEHVRDLYYCPQHFTMKAMLLDGQLYCTACLHASAYSLLYTDETVIAINSQKLDKPVIRV